MSLSSGMFSSFLLRWIFIPARMLPKITRITMQTMTTLSRESAGMMKIFMPHLCHTQSTRRQARCQKRLPADCWE